MSNAIRAPALTALAAGRALLFLATRSFANAVRFRLQRLRQPKYLLGAALGALYFYYYFYRFLLRPDVAVPPLTGLGGAALDLASVALLVIVIVSSWLRPAPRAALQFTEAEIAWLFPAPVTRQTLIRYKLLTGQLGILFTALVLMLLTGRFARGGHPWMLMFGWWVMLSTVRLHRLGASFALQRLAERGMADARRRFAALLILAGGIACVWLWQRTGNLPLPGPDANFRLWAAWLHAHIQTGPAPYLLWPFRAMLAPAFARQLPEFLTALSVAVGILVLHYIWVVRANVSFEDAALALAQERATLLARRQSGNNSAARGEGGRANGAARRPLFRLRPMGFAPIAFLWKHQLSSNGVLSMRLWIIVGGAALAATVLGGTFITPLFAVVGATIGGSLFIMAVFSAGPMSAQVMRREVAAIDLLKAFPLPGWQVVFGELLGPLLDSVLLQWLAIATLYASVAVTPNLAPFAHPAIAFGVALFGLPVILTLMIIPAGITLLFPAWLGAGNPTQGIEAMGLRMLSALTQLLALAVAIIPASLIGIAVWLLTNFLGGRLTGLVGRLADIRVDGLLDGQLVPLALGALAAGITLCVEAAAGVAWLGLLYDRLDSSAER